MGQIKINRDFESLLFLHLNCVFMVNGIVLNGTVLTFKLRTYAKLNYLK